MRAGCHAGVITPPIPSAMGGYGARTGPAEGVHDDLYVRSLVLEDGGVRLGLIICDLLNVDRTLVEQVRERVWEAAGIAPEAIMLAASHTHSGPATRIWIGEAAPEEYRRWLALQLASSLIQAAAHLEEVEVAGATGAVEGLGTNRTDPGLPFDPTVRLLALRASDRPRAVLLNYGCHPTVMGPENRLISADWPGAAVAMLTRALGAVASDGSTWVGFAQGACGDVSARFARRAQSFAEVERFGSLLAGAALSLLGNLDGYRPGGGLGARSQVVRLEPAAMPTAAEAERQVAAAEAHLAALREKGASHGEMRLAQTALEGARLASTWRQRQGLLDFDGEVQALRIGADAAIVGLAGEPFSSLGRAIRERSPFATTLVVGYANGYCGYLPDQEAFGRGGYEASSAYTAPGSGERLVETAVALLAELWAEVG